MICVHEQADTDYSTNGLGVITPSECTVHWTENGEYTLEIEHPIDQLGKYERLCAYGRVVVAPVPVRESPLYEFTEDITEGEDVTVTRNVWTVSGTTVGLYMRSGPGTQYGRYGYLKNGAKVTEIGRKTVSGRMWVHVIVQKGGRNCWMSTKWLRKTGTVTEIVQQAKVVGQRTITREQHREQPFDIYAWEPDVDRVTAKARHVFWRLAGNLVCSLEIENKTAQQAMDALFAAAEYQDHGFEWHCDATPAMSLENPIEGKNLVDAILGEGGICDTYGLKLMVDWYDIYLLKDSGADHGVQIRYGKNLMGMTGGFDMSHVVTRVLPVGQTKDGKPLYMSGAKYLESPHAALYREPIYGYLKVNDAKVGSKPEGSKKQLTAAQARARLKAAAQAELDKGCDLPECSLNVEMAQLRRDPAYSEYADLEIICPGDTLGLFVPNFGLALNVRLTEYEYDALSGQYAELTIGSPSRNMSNSGITSRQLGGASVTASKLAANAVGASAIQDDVISARHMQAESVNADAIQADAITTDKLAANSVTAEKLSADAINADKIKTVTLEAMVSWLRTVTSESITTDELAAQFARLQVLIAGTATFDQATIQRLVAEAMHLTYGELGRVYIDNLMVNYAQMVSAAIGDLVVKASDGNYYHLDVAQDGSVTATQVTVTEGEINAGQTSDGRAILETDITATNLNTTNLFATYELVNRIDAARIDVDELFAREAFLTLLRTSHIVGDKSLEIVVQDTEAAAKDAASARETVDNLQVGGRNLLRNSTGNLGNASFWSAMALSTEGYNGSNCLILKRTGFTASGRLLASNSTVNEPLLAAGANADFVVSGYYYVDSSVDLDGDNNQVFARFGGENNGENFIDTVAVKIGRGAAKDKWIEFSEALKIPDNNFKTAHFIVALEKNGCIRFSQLKLECGNRATDWTPAPEDVDSRIDDTAESLSGQIGGVAERLDDCVTHPEQATYMRVVAPGENPATPPGVYVGLSTNGERPAAEAFVDASGWFRVLNNGVSITSLGPRIQELGTLKIYETADGGHAFI